MKSRSDIDKTRIESVVDPICRAHGVELVEVVYAREAGGAVLRVLIDRERPSGADPKPGSGVTLDDCKAVSRDIGTALDAEDESLPSARYRLEVGSPRLDRPLVRPRDFERFAGEQVKVQTTAEIPGAEPERRRFSGVLKGIDGQLVQLEEVSPAVSGEKAGTRVLSIPLDTIQKAHLVPRFG